MKTTDPTLRQCGLCTACCDGWLTATINGASVRPGQPCPHSTPVGCDIYSTRPEIPCRIFVCGWMNKDSPLPDWMRPSDCGAIITLSYDWPSQKVIKAVPIGSKIPERTLDWLKAYAQKHGRPLIFTERIERDGKYVGVQCFGFGPKDFRESVQDLQLAGQQAELIEMYRSLPADI